MFKKRFIWLGVTAMLACVILIQPVRAAAESALAVFRVDDAKTITITATDLQDIITGFNKSGVFPSSKDSDGQAQSSNESQNSDKLKSQLKTLNNVREFTAFSFSLPTALKSEVPKLSAVDGKSQTITLNTTEINAELAKMSATTMLDSSLNGSEITVDTPASVMAEYSDVTLIATQSVYIDAPDATTNSLWSSILSIPAIPDDLRVQLAEIDPKTRDVYLPVIEGLGRETDLGSVTGYIYSTSDLTQVASLIPNLNGGTQLVKSQGENESALIWVKNGVLYCLAGQKSDSELSQIARSIK